VAGYLGFAGAALALAVAAVILASVSAGLRGVKDVKVDVASRESRMQEVVASSGRLLFESKLAAGAGAACLVLALILRFAR
jgi:hypothetical protein